MALVLPGCLSALAQFGPVGRTPSFGFFTSAALSGFDRCFPVAVSGMLVWADKVLRFRDGTKSAVDRFWAVQKIMVKLLRLDSLRIRNGRPNAEGSATTRKP